MKPRTFLLVDDAPAARATMRRQIEQCHTTPPAFLEAEDTQTAIRLCGAGVTAVFTGLKLANDERGVLLVERLLRDNPGLPVVVCTSMPPDHLEVREALSLGIRALLSKPCTLDQVRRALEDIERDTGRVGRIV